VGSLAASIYGDITEGRQNGEKEAIDPITMALSGVGCWLLLALFSEVLQRGPKRRAMARLSDAISAEEPGTLPNSWTRGVQTVEKCPPLMEAQGGVPTVRIYPVTGKPGIGRLLEVNSERALPVKGDGFSGKFLFLHRPNPFNLAMAKESSNPHVVHFCSVKRNWEMRLQCQFTEDIGRDVFLTAEVAGPTGIRGTMAGVTASAILNTVTLMNRAIGNSFGYSLDFTYQEDGSIERAHLVWPLLNADTIIATPKGEAPPDIMTSYKDSSWWARPSTLDKDHVYTFVWHSMYLDFFLWEVRQILGMRRGFEMFLGHQPIHLNWFKLRPAEERPRNVSLFAESNKQYMISLVVEPPRRIAPDGITEDEVIP
jgi:hypothetical protein